MAVSLPNQPLSPHSSLLNDNSPFLSITPPPTWSEAALDAQNSHIKLETEISAPHCLLESRSSSGSPAIEMSTEAPREVLPISDPRVTPSNPSVQTSLRRPQSEGSLSGPPKSAFEEEIDLEEPNSTLNMSTSSPANDQLNDSGRPSSSTLIVHASADHPALPHDESPPAQSSIPTTRQPRHRDSDLNTDFSFPMQQSSDLTRRLDDLYFATHGHTPRTRPRSSRTPAHDLPDFSFGSNNNSGATTGPESPSHDTSSHSGDIEGPQNGGDPGLISSGASQSELQPPATRWNLGPPGGTSFHRHRRSGAALSISKDGPVLPRLRAFGSAPSTPVELPQFNMEDQMARADTPSNTTPEAEMPPSPRRRESAPSATRRRPLHPTAPFQPRPLSIIASDSGSNSSIDKDIHKASGSLNSLGSGPASPFLAATAPNATIDATLTEDSASIDLTTVDTKGISASTGEPQMNVVSDLVSLDLLASAANDYLIPSTPEKASPPKIPRSVPTDFSQVSTPSKMQASSYGVDQGPLGNRSRRHPGHRRAESSIEVPRPRTSPGRAQSEQANEYPEPLPDFPMLKSQDADLALPDDINFDDESSTAVLEAPPSMSIGITQLQLPAHEIKDTWMLEPSSQSNSPLPSPSSGDYPHVIDLDDTSGSLPERGLESVSSSAAAALQRRMRMHSSGRRGGYSGSAMQYHRRAESAPEMPPPSFAGAIHNVEMADVFEEEEEEQGGNIKAVSQSIANRDVSAREVPGDDLVGSNTSKAEKEPPHNETGKPVEETVDAKKVNLAGTEVDPIHPTDQGVQVVDEEGWNASVARSSDSTLTPREAQEAPVKRPVSASMDITVRTPASFYAPSDFHSSAPSSGFPSPDPGNVSFDHPRLPTATSSITDRGTFNSAASGENYWGGVRGSVDRTPELTEDDDSMITGAIPRHSSGGVTSSSVGEHRSAMTAGLPPTSPVRPGRSSTARKRGSLASLSKLMTTPGSKLRNEEKAPDDATEHTEGKKKNRLSRLMGIFRKS